jgi:hypothetical protein
MKEVAGKRRRFGYRRIGIMLERQGMTMNHKKLYRLYREEGLSVRRRRGANGRGAAARRCLCRWLRGALVDGLCVRHLRRLTQIPDSGDQ